MPWSIPTPAVAAVRSTARPTRALSPFSKMSGPCATSAPPMTPPTSAPISVERTVCERDESMRSTSAHGIRRDGSRGSPTVISAGRPGSGGIRTASAVSSSRDASNSRRVVVTRRCPTESHAAWSDGRRASSGTGAASTVSAGPSIDASATA